MERRHLASFAQTEEISTVWHGHHRALNITLFRLLQCFWGYSEHSILFLGAHSAIYAAGISCAHHFCASSSASRNRCAVAVAIYRTAPKSRADNRELASMAFDLGEKVISVGVIRLFRCGRIFYNVSSSQAGEALTSTKLTPGGKRLSPMEAVSRQRCQSLKDASFKAAWLRSFAEALLALQ